MTNRGDFRRNCIRRDGSVCTVPWCSSEISAVPENDGEVHHIIERELWKDGGYITDNGTSVCNLHHQYAEENKIPPQAFWRWLSIENPPLPDAVRSPSVNKWGESFETPPHETLREFHKYPSTRHLLPLYWQSERGTASQRTGRDDTGLSSVDSFLDVPLVATVKMDGSNAMLVKDEDNPVRARNGSDAAHESFDHLKQLYWQKDVYSELPSHLQVFGEWLYAKHSIKYEGEIALRDYFQVFGVFDTRYNLWLSWPETEYWANKLGFVTTPLVEEHTLDKNFISNEQEFVQHFTEQAERVVDMGHEGIVIRWKFPFHYGQFGEALGKYVRPNHVKTDEHWSHKRIEQNECRD